MCEFTLFLCEFAQNDYLRHMQTFGKIMLIDDNPDVLFSLKFLLEPYCSRIETAQSPAEALKRGTAFRPDVWMADMNFRQDALSGQEGFRLLREILDWDPQAVVVLMTAYSDTDKAVQAIKEGATDFVSKPWEKDKLLATLSAAFRARALKLQVQDLSHKVEVMAQTEHPEQEVIGQSPAMEQVMRWVEKLDGADANVLITGENGTGKDLMAQVLHKRSGRKAKPMIGIDLGSVPETLFESELFGYEKGAFTDAQREKPGRIEVAHGSTLFLNEIGNLKPALQAKLLQVLETRTVQRLGAVQSIPIDVRLLCATNRNLVEAVEEGAFREDLLYRINTVEIHLPALRERGQDILLLAQHFLSLYAAKYGKSVPQLSREAQTQLLKYAWPGNVRELQHVMERAIIFASGATLPAEALLFRPVSTSRKAAADTLNLDQIERRTIERALGTARGNISRAAELLGITRYALYRKIEKYGL